MSDDFPGTPTRDRRNKSVMSPEERDRLKNLEVEMKFLRRDTDFQTEMMKSNQIKLDSVLAFLQETKGSWKALTAVGAAGGAITAAIVEAVRIFKGL